MTDIYVNIFMSTQETKAVLFLTILNFFTIYSVLNSKSALNIVSARTPAKPQWTVNFIYLHHFFVQLNNYHFLILRPLLFF